ncbi:cistern family PEP-CTERM protein [Sphingomonas crocodyli]|nr:cistern family PEP-CTERM protein [Sphingomonas crocodyli]
MRNLALTAMTVIGAATLSVPAAATVFDFNDVVTVKGTNVGMGWTIDFEGMSAQGNETNKVGATGTFTYTGLTNGGKTYNFNYTLKNDSAYSSYVHALGFDTTGAFTAFNATGALASTSTNVQWPSSTIGTLDLCMGGGGGSNCVAHYENGVRNQGTGSFAITFGNVMSSIDLDHFAVKFLDLSRNIDKNDWALGVGRVTSMTSGADDIAVITAPEPMTWMMMLVGFGLIGAAVRRRPAKGVTTLQTA